MATEKEKLIRAYTAGVIEGAEAVLEMLNENKTPEEMRKEIEWFANISAGDAAEEIMAGLKPSRRAVRDYPSLARSLGERVES